MEPVNKWKPEWIVKYKAQYLKEAKDGTLTFRKVAADFEMALNKDTIISQGTVAKGAFRPMFDSEGSEKARPDKSQSNPPKKRSRPVSIQSMCIVCKRTRCATLEKYYYAFPETAPKDWRFQSRLQEIALKNIQKKYIKEKLTEIRNKRRKVV